MYQKGDTYICSVEVKNNIGNLTDPTSISCTILKPDGTSAASGAMTKTATGKYEYKYTLPSDAATGMWKAKVTAVSGSMNTVDEIVFEVN